MEPRDYGPFPYPNIEFFPLTRGIAGHHGAPVDIRLRCELGRSATMATGSAFGG
jgi:hypothetical protein